MSDALRHNVETLSPISIVWEYKIDSPMPIREWLAAVEAPAYGIGDFDPCTFKYCWQDGMSYMHILQRRVNLSEVIDRSTHELKPGANLDEVEYFWEEMEAACNLQDAFYGHGQECRRRVGALSSLTIDPIEDPKTGSADGRLFKPDYFREAGFILPRMITEQASWGQGSVVASA